MPAEKVFIAVPIHKGEASCATSNAIVTAASSRADRTINYQILGLSLLARNFNTLFCNAYNKGYDYIIYLHSDVGVHVDGNFVGSWGDLLVDRTKQLELAALSVVIPIKSQEGYTSAGIQLKRGNPYSLRRITVKQLSRLPRDFISREDVCKIYGIDPAEAGAMLINTGCLCMDLKAGWAEARWPGFSIDDKIAWNKSGVPQAFTIPEDWNLSTWLFNKGWTYYNTKELGISHIGFTSFENRGEWGQDEDTAEIQPNIEEYENSE